MKTRTLTKSLKAIMFVASLNFIGCNQSVLTGSKTCSLKFEEKMKQYQDDLTAGLATAEDEPIECNLPVEEPGADLKVNLVMRNFTTEQERKMLDAVERIKVVINSMDFKDRVLAHTYNGEVTFVDNNGLSNEEIYEKIMLGAEILQPEVDKEMDVDVTMYYKPTSTVGYTYPDTNRTWVNSRFFSGYTPGQIAANVTHEWTHKLGFTHSFYNNAARPFTVPYGIGGIIQELVDSL